VLASIGAGAIHATAVGVHGPERAAAIAFGALAVLQIGWGLLALAPVSQEPGPRRWLPWAGLAVNGAAVGGWVLAKTVGIGFVPGLETSEGPGIPDTLSAALGLAAMAGALACLFDPAWLRSRGAPVTHVPVAAAVAVLVLTGMVATGSHTHGPGGHGHDMESMTIGDGHDHGDDHGSDPDHDHGEDPGFKHGDDHDHPGSDDPDHDHPGSDDPDHDHPGSDDPDHDHPGSDDPDHDHPGPSTPHDPHHPGPDRGDPHGRDPHGHPGPGDDDPGIPCVDVPGHPGHDHDPAPQGGHPYTATLPVDLSGFPGVTPQQQHTAEALVTATLTKLPRFKDTASAERLGYHSIGDASTGYEHFVNWTMIDDEFTLDPAHPESLVYRVNSCTGERELVAAMFMLNHGTTLDEVPDVGGPMTQWHEHTDLCWGGTENAWYVTTTADPSLPCPGGSFRLEPVPMIHVWVVPHECGPFAALEGVGGGQIPDGETRLCDHVHGSH
jgi:hypothetical protein